MESVGPWTISSTGELETFVSIALAIAVKVIEDCCRLSIHICGLETREAWTPAVAKIYGRKVPAEDVTATKFRTGMGNSVHTPEAGELGIWVPIIFRGHVTGVRGSVKHGLDCR